MIQSDSEGEGLVVPATKETRQICWLGGAVEAINAPGAGLAASGASVAISHSNPRLPGPMSMVLVGGPRSRATSATDLGVEGPRHSAFLLLVLHNGLLPG